MRLSRIGILLLCTSGLAQQPPLQRVPDRVRAERNIVYAKTPQKDLLLDLYVPKSDAPLPVVVWVHGGAWRAGSKDRTPALRLTMRGYAVASIAYRLSSDAIFPAQIHDVKAAVRWLRANASTYGLDPKRFAAWGSSAGGHLVALLGTSGGVKELEGELGNVDQSSRVQAVVDFFGPTDFAEMNRQGSTMDHDSPKAPEALLLGGPVQQNMEAVKRANPITYVTADDPPFLIMHGDKDPLVPLGQSKLLLDALTKAAVRAELVVVPGAGHGFGGPQIDAKVDAFLDKHLKQ